MKTNIYRIFMGLMIALTMSSCSGTNYFFGPKTTASTSGESKLKTDERLMVFNIEEGHEIDHEVMIDRGGMFPEKAVQHEQVKKYVPFSVVNLCIWLLAFASFIGYIIGASPIDAHSGWVNVDGHHKWVSYTDFGAGEDLQSAPEGCGMQLSLLCFMLVIGGALFYVEYNWILDNLLETRKGIVAVPVGAGILAEIWFLFYLFRGQIAMLMILSWLYVLADFCLGAIIMLCNVNL